MTHTFTDEEYKEYIDIKEAFLALKQFGDDVLARAKSFYQTHPLPCHSSEDYGCGHCPIGFMIPGNCPTGKEKR